MTPEQFTYWLQGFTEISGTEPTKEQWQIIKDHLGLVFKKVTPDYNFKPIDNIGVQKEPDWMNIPPIIC